MAVDAELPAPLQQAIQMFRDWVGPRLQLEQTHNIITEPLYHYTDSHGLKGIMESGQIWFTDYRHLNDPSELKYGLDMTRRAAEKIAAATADGFLATFLNLFIDMFQHHQFEDTLDFYIASFSRKRNNLGQWRAYADNGRGFAIGFARTMFEIESHSTDCRLPEFLGPVFYPEFQVFNRLHAVVKKAAAILQETFSSHTSLLQNTALTDAFMQHFAREMIAQPLILYCLTAKHEAYAHEQEVRLVIRGQSAVLRPHVTTRLRGREIVPYIKHPMPVRANIHEIVIGPAAPTDTDRTLRVMLNSLGIDPTNINIDQSRIPYRAL
jgi:Protein of unknown function (DUF2971)